MIVVDTNVLVYFWISGEHTKQAERLFEKDSQWAAPLLWRSEFRNVLSGLVKREAISFATAANIAEQVESQMKGMEFSVPTFEVLDRANVSGCTAYDCEFVVLAEGLGVPLVTSDKQVLKAFPRIAKSLN